MNDIWLIFKKEWLAFLRSDRGIFLSYGIMIIAWSFLLASNMNKMSSGTGYLWLVFFSVLVSANFSNTTFIAERITGSLEILITSGLNRSLILAGKIIFIVVMSTVLGIFCYGVAILIKYAQGENLTLLLQMTSVLGELFLYISACLMNASCSAWLSVKMSSPRLLHFVNLFLLASVVIVHTIISQFQELTLWSLSIGLLVMSAVFIIFAIRAFKSEKVIQPIVY